MKTEVQRFAVMKEEMVECWIVGTIWLICASQRGASLLSNVNV